MCQKRARVHFTEKKNIYIWGSTCTLYAFYMWTYLTFRMPRSIYTFSKATVNLKVTLSVPFENVRMFIGIQGPAIYKLLHL